MSPASGSHPGAQPVSEESARYRLRPVVGEDVGPSRWVAPLPDGPIARVDGIGPLILDLLAEEDAPCDRDRIATLVRRRVADAPSEAETALAVGRFLVQLVELRVVETC